MLDYLPGGNMGGIYGEALKDVQGEAGRRIGSRTGRRASGTSIRARIEGAAPHIQVWMNGVLVTDWTDTANHLPGGAAEGMIAVQVHGGNRCTPA